MQGVNVTKRQHYLPQAYLKRWRNENGELAASINGKVVFSNATTNFAVENGFYSFVDLSSAELEFLLRIISQIIAHENPIVDFIITPIFLIVLYFRCKRRDWTEEYGVVFDKFFPWMQNQEHIKEYRFLRLVAEGETELRQKHIDAIERETLSGFESLMTGIENAAWPVINSLLTNGVKCLKDSEHLRSFLLYLINQSFRGPDYLRYIECALPQRAREIGETSKLAKYLRYIFPFYACNQIFKIRDQLKGYVIENCTDLEFITGDVPCVVYGEKQEQKIPTISYFPLSPQKAILFGYKKAINKYIEKYGWKLMDKNLVDWFNREVVSSSERFVFASKVSVLIENDYRVHRNTLA